MSDRENVLARWSRLKQEAEKEKPRRPVEASVPDNTTAEPAKTGPVAGAPTAAEPAFDLASLPSLESITGNTDIRDFLRSEVPADLARAALRRAWTADPAIRDFIGLAENQWDFTDPAAIPGFGPLHATDNVPDLVARAMGKLQDAVASAETTPAAVTRREPADCSPPERDVATVTGQTSGLPYEISLAAGTAHPAEQNSRVDVAAQHDDPSEKTAASSNRRTHGSALPK